MVEAGRHGIPGVARVAALLCAAMLGGFAAQGDPGGAAPSDHTLRFAEFAFDPAQGQPVLPPGWDRSSQAAPDLHLVQFDGPIPGDAPEQLRAAGLEPVQYVFPDTYIVWGRGADRERMNGRARVRWTGDFAPAYRVQKDLRERGGDMLDVRVLIYRGARADTVVEALSRLGTATGRRTIIDDRFEIASFRLRGDLMRFAASVPGVYSIQPVRGSGPRAPRSPPRSTSITSTNSILPTRDTRHGCPASDSTEREPPSPSSTKGSTNASRPGGEPAALHRRQLHHRREHPRHARRRHRHRQRRQRRAGRQRFPARAGRGARIEDPRAGIHHVPLPAGRRVRADDGLAPQRRHDLEQQLGRFHGRSGL